MKRFFLLILNIHKTSSGALQTLQVLHLQISLSMSFMPAGHITNLQFQCGYIYI